jgi:hypothetical protein
MVFFFPWMLVIVLFAVIAAYRLRYASVLLPWPWLRYIQLEVSDQLADQTDFRSALERDMLAALAAVRTRLARQEQNLKRIVSTQQGHSESLQQTESGRNSAAVTRALLKTRAVHAFQQSIIKKHQEQGQQEPPAATSVAVVELKESTDGQNFDTHGDEENADYQRYQSSVLELQQEETKVVQELATIRSLMARPARSVNTMLTVRTILYFWIVRAVAGITIQLLLQVPMNYIMMTYDNPGLYAQLRGYAQVVADEFEMRSLACFLLSAVRSAAEGLSALLYLF